MARPLTSTLGAGFCALTLLAACGSDTTATVPAFEQLASELQTAAAEFEALPPTPFADLPTGQVNYLGLFGSSSLTEIAPEEDFLAIVGDMTVAVDFAGNAITGTASNLVRGDGTQLDGTISLTGGSIAANGPGASMTGALNGDLTFGEDGFYDFNNFQVTGAFAGDQGAALAAAGEGEFRFEGSDDVVAFGMGFIVQAQD